MRRFVMKFLILLALVWGGWWYLATSSVQIRVNAWLDDRRAEGWQADTATVSRAGFPLRITTVVEGMSLTDPETQSSMQIPQATLSSPIYWPGHATVQFPAGPVTFVTTQDTGVLNSDGMKATMRLRPGTDLELEALSAASSNVSFDLTGGPLFSLQKLQAEVQQGRTPETYKIDLVATGLALGSTFVEELALPAPWPDTFEPIVADMTIAFDRPWDRSALKEARPQPRNIRINEATLSFADTGLTIDGELTVDTAGIPAGALRLRVRNWQGLFEMAVASTAVPAEWAPTVERMLQSMSDLEGALDLTLTAQNGQMRVGFFPLGPAPRLIIR